LTNEPPRSGPAATTATSPPTPGPLAGLRVLVPRSPDRAGPLVAALVAAGALPVLAPLVQIGPPADPEPMDDAVARLAGGELDWVAVTSSFAIDGLVAAAARAGTTLAAVIASGRSARAASTRVAAVGDATAAALARAGIHADFVPARLQSARGMLAEWPPSADDAVVLVPQSDLAEPTLAEGLAARGWRVRVVVAYTNTPAAPLPSALAADLAAGVVGAVVLTSGSAARRLAAQVRIPASTAICCIGPRTAEVAASLGLPVGVVATEPGPAAIIAALARAVRTRTATRTATRTEPEPEVTA